MLNNNFSKLIKLYEKYQRKQRIKLFFKLLGALLLIAAGYLIYLQNHQSSTDEIKPATTATESTLHEQKEIETGVNQQQSAQTEPVKTAVETPKEEEMPQKVIKRTSTSTQSAEENEPFQLKVNQRESLYKMLVAYKDQKSYKTAIKIAQFYLLQKEYKKAVKWAVEASKKDPSQAQSWIIYAKAKKALGKPDVAKRALGIYLKHNFSQEAKDLYNLL